MISQSAEYALRAVVDLAYNFPGGRTTQQIADATKVPMHYLAKILQDLGRAHLVRSQRGLGGGFTLESNPKAVTVLDVLNAVDPPRRILQCPLKLTSHAHELCPLHQKLDDAMASAEEAFRSTTIADVTAPGPRQPLRNSKANLTISPGLGLAAKRKRIRRKRS